MPRPRPNGLGIVAPHFVSYHPACVWAEFRRFRMPPGAMGIPSGSARGPSGRRPDPLFESWFSATILPCKSNARK